MSMPMMRPPLRRRTRWAIPAVAVLWAMTMVVAPTSTLARAICGEHKLARLDIGRARRFVAEQGVRPLDDGAGDGDALLLAAEQLR